MAVGRRRGQLRFNKISYGFKEMECGCEWGCVRAVSGFQVVNCNVNFSPGNIKGNKSAVAPVY